MNRESLHQADIELLKGERDEARKAAREMLARVISLANVTWRTEERERKEWFELYPWLAEETTDDGQRVPPGCG